MWRDAASVRIKLKVPATRRHHRERATHARWLAISQVRFLYVLPTYTWMVRTDTASLTYRNVQLRLHFLLECEHRTPICQNVNFFCHLTYAFYEIANFFRCSQGIRYLKIPEKPSFRLSAKVSRTDLCCDFYERRQDLKCDHYTFLFF